MKALWYPGTVRRPGPAHKAHGPRNRTTAAVYHSAVGSLSASFGVLDGPSVSAWHLTNAKDGRLFQHFPMDRLLYHARGGNSWSIGVENEGGPIGNTHEPLTEAQITNLANLSAWLVEEGWLPGLTRTGDKTLWEHREIPGSSTACPSGRIPWGEIIERAEGEDMEELDRHKKFAAVSAMFTKAAGYALAGQQMPAQLRAAIKFVLG